MEYITTSLLSTDKKPEIILNGNILNKKILTLRFSGVRLIDSFSFLPFALEKFPKTFGLTELKKDFFLIFLIIRASLIILGSCQIRNTLDQNTLIVKRKMNLMSGTIQKNEKFTISNQNSKHTAIQT